MTRPAVPGALGESGRLYAGPQDGAVVRIPRAGATTIRAAGALYRRTTAVDAAGLPIYHHTPTTPQERTP